MQGEYTKSKKTDQEIKRITKQSIADFGERQTEKYLTGLEQCLQLLADNPNLGRTCNELGEGYQRHISVTNMKAISFFTGKEKMIFLSLR